MNLFNDIYDLTYLPLLTPTNLIENLSLDNFHKINYSKNKTGILAEVLCTVDKQKINFYYQFDCKNFLDKIYYYENKQIEYLFNRKKILGNLRDEFSSEKVL
ncbi:hypothetical protein ACWJU0_05000 [Clostridioides difficile]|uniref:hypothetical protein n=1 Tax=Clostridioides difficile TaxID=1496 RepID=UPI000826AF5E|nr:hypothetical protein [Clostridioides difficile]MBY1132819.1 hypothetical protein [Clostridioides difficile]MBY1883371.1 hypothetical protein [Clostridioides difficile]MBZ0782265.1 hypothetical protein [Clostridioides difficile]MBZ0854552.1 hypothetical protein [Clostridioides difficile]MCA0566545.1 hypothetical protein [Clostridioides difficile]